jgi:uncharacterized protein with NRDE domain
MCTLLYAPWEGGPFRAALGLNRDEVYARPAAPPRWWPPTDGAGVGFVAPVDLAAGGTWFGLAETGLFAALTNGRLVGHSTAPGPAAGAGPFRHERSRGELVPAALRAGTLEDATAALGALDGLAYAPCHLLLAQDGRAAYVAPDAGGRFTALMLEPGPHTLTNSGLDAGDAPRLALSPEVDTPVRAVAALQAVLATHTGPLARCRHGADRGTRSSAVVLLGPDLPSSRLYFADGRPCATPFAEVRL